MIEEWSASYPRLSQWIDLFADRPTILAYRDIQQIIEPLDAPVKDVIDALYEVGFIGFRAAERSLLQFSFSSKGRPGYDHIYYVHYAFFHYLKEKAAELGHH